MTIGNRIFLKRPTCSVDLLKEFEQLPAANIADTMNRIAFWVTALTYLFAEKADYGGVRHHRESPRGR
ncbi:dimethylmenaquinone methyltransferase [Klebsiella michiganensis]|nr:dimethylmenaquinone methyltransferase [Klebsiella michiganensis]